MRPYVTDICPSCKSLSKFYYSSDKKHQTYCIGCSSLRAKAYKRKIKVQVIGHYGGACSCCGNRVIEFLSIDHIQGNGRKHRQTINKIGSQFYMWLRKENYPNGFRVLCHNCNMSLGIYGYCPHKELEPI